VEGDTIRSIRETYLAGANHNPVDCDAIPLVMLTVNPKTEYRLTCSVSGTMYCYMELEVRGQRLQPISYEL
jgi:hypothetical protein